MRAIRFGTVAVYLVLSSCSGMAPRAAPPQPTRLLVAKPLEPAPRTMQAQPPAERLARSEPPAFEPALPATEHVTPVPGPAEVLIFQAGTPAGVIARSDAAGAGLQLLDLGEAWVPRLLRSTPGLPNDYASVFAALANGEYPEGPEGRLAAQERYLEPHGIPPTPALLERRFVRLAEQPCSTRLDLQPLQTFEGVEWTDGAGAPSIPDAVVLALQARLACEGHLRVPPSGVPDEATRAALEEFERRNRIYARGELKGETLEALRAEPLELERRTLLRVLTERAVLDLAALEDGSADPRRDVVRDIEAQIREALGLHTVEDLQRFYARLGPELQHPHLEIAVDAVALPDYYAADMDLWVEIDRGDLYYEFPFDEHGQPLGFEIERGPTLTLFARDGERVLPLVLYPTTIGGWRVRQHGGAVYWEYKNSPVGLRAWRRIVAAPVWLPPASTPPEHLVVKLRRSSDGSEFFELNYNLVGPSFASAYGLVAAYHQPVLGTRAGELELGRDHGIRTHGSSDYTSIWRTVSSGCHRLHNHLAIRLFNFILAHRTNRRVGHRPLHYRLNVSTPDLEAQLRVRETGYEYYLEQPIEVRVLPGRVRGTLQHPVRRRIPAAVDAADRPRVIFEPQAPGGS
jgi:Putative peptidoglycan binding domain